MHDKTSNADSASPAPRHDKTSNADHASPTPSLPDLAAPGGLPFFLARDAAAVGSAPLASHMISNPGLIASLPKIERRRPRRSAFPDHGQPLFRFLERQYARALSLPAELVLRLMNLPQLDRPVPQRRTTLSATRLSSASAAIVEAIERDGFCVSSLTALGIPGSKAMLAAALDLSQKLARRARADAGRHTIFANAADLLAQPRIFHWGLDEGLLDIVEAYLGTPAAYDGASYFYSVADGREAGTRVWHRDREDHRMLKVALYISNVTREDGPLELLRRSWQERLDARRTRWRYASLRQADLDAALPDADPEDTIHSLAGPPGTVLFIDTARHHHRGRPPTGQDRSAIYHSYFPRRPRHPFCCERSPLSRTEIATFARDLPQRQRDAMLWRQALTGPLSWIPRDRPRS
jgi:hypothetical protein